MESGCPELKINVTLKKKEPVLPGDLNIKIKLGKGGGKAAVTEQAEELNPFCLSQQDF
jgi:dual specificity tyrosine-phosphorylation-regulated kinase 2/3/4